MTKERSHSESIKSVNLQIKKIKITLRKCEEASTQAIEKYIATQGRELELSADIYLEQTMEYENLLNRLASLVDYYYIYIAEKLGAPNEKIRNVQYSKITNYLAIQKHIGKGSKHKSWRDLMEYLRPQLEEKFEPSDKWDIDYFIWGDVFKDTLVKWGVMAPKTPAYEENKDANGKIKLTINKKIETYYALTEFLHCSKTGVGHRYNVFLELNNCLKHNKSPDVSYEVQLIQNQYVAFSYFTIKEDSYHYLNDGILKTFAELDYKKLKTALDFRFKNPGLISPLENEIGLTVINVDRENHYERDKSLYFYIDNVLIKRQENSISVNIFCLQRATNRLIGEINRYLN